MAANDISQNKSPKGKGMSQEQLGAIFQEMRNQQRMIANKISELQMERKEHDLVIEALREVDQGRKCFRMVGGVLVERTVTEVLPALTSNYEQLGKVVDSLTKQMETKGRELNDFKEQHNIRIRNDEDNPSAGPSDADNKATGVLVS